MTTVRIVAVCSFRLLSVVFLWLSLLSVARAADITYVYDELGRLKAVIDPTSDAAVYQYDAVGNLLAISRQSSALVSLIDFTSKSGPVGTQVTIYGTGFSTTPIQNIVTFNGIAAVVLSATPTQIVATVPGGATSGSVSVTTSTGSATSSVSFTVTVAGGPGGAPCRHLITPKTRGKAGKSVPLINPVG